MAYHSSSWKIAFVVHSNSSRTVETMGMSRHDETLLEIDTDTDPRDLHSRRQHITVNYVL